MTNPRAAVAAVLRCRASPKNRLARNRRRDWARGACGWILEIVQRDSDVKDFVLLPRRWGVERTFSWLGNYRRLSKDYEYRAETSEAMIHAAMTRLMLRRLAPTPKPPRRRDLLPL